MLWGNEHPHFLITDRVPSLSSRGRILRAKRASSLALPVYMATFFFFFNFWVCLFIYLFIYGCVGSLFLWEGFLQLRQVGATLHHSARASHYRRLSSCGAQAPDAQAQ